MNLYRHITLHEKPPMKKSRIQLLALCAAFMMTGCLAPRLYAQKNAGEVIKAMQDRYERLLDFETDFLQIEVWELTGAVDTLSGVMAHLKKEFFKIETGNVHIMTDGVKVWEYNIPDKQVIIDKLDEEQDSFLLKTYLFDFPKRFITVDFRREERDGRQGYYIEMEPKKPDEEAIQSLHVWIDAADTIVKMVRVTDFNDNDVIYILKNFRADVGLEPGDFQLKIPEGEKVKIIDLTKGD